MNQPLHQPTPEDATPSTVPSSDFPQLRDTTPPPLPLRESLTDRALWYTGLCLCGVLLLGQLIDLVGWPSWSKVVYRLVLLLEAALPLGVSFFLKDARKATVLRILGIVVLVLYIATLF